jgi:hypothetical protein
VALRAVLKRLAVAQGMKMAAEIHGMTGSRGHARSALACAHRIVRIPAAQRRKGEEDGGDNGVERLLAHNRLRHTRHA